MINNYLTRFIMYVDQLYRNNCNSNEKIVKALKLWGNKNFNLIIYIFLLQRRIMSVIRLHEIYYFEIKLCERSRNDVQFLLKNLFMYF